MMKSNSNYDQESARHPAFNAQALAILKKQGQLIVFCRYLANKEYHCLSSEKEWESFLNTRAVKEALTLFKLPFVLVKRGVVDQGFLTSLLEKIRETNEVDWVIMGLDNTEPWSTWVANEVELKEVLEDEMGARLMVIEDQNWFDENITIHGYIPDEDSIVRPGAY